MKIIFSYALIFLFVLTACSDFGFLCKYWILTSVENEPTNSFGMVVCDNKLIPDLSPQDYSNRMVIQRANALLHSKPELKSCSVINEAPGHTSSGLLVFGVICDGGKPLKKKGTYWKARYTY